MTPPHPRTLHFFGHPLSLARDSHLGWRYIGEINGVELDVHTLSDGLTGRWKGRPCVNVVACAMDPMSEEGWSTVLPFLPPEEALHALELRVASLRTLFHSLTLRADHP